MIRAALLAVMISAALMMTYRHGQPYVKCDGCNGTGKPWYGTPPKGTNCWRCQGFGYVKLVKCKYCKDWVQGECYRCFPVIPAGD